MANTMVKEGGIEQVRDLLFGSQVKEQEKQLSQLEQRIMREHEVLRSDVRQQLNELESFLKQEFDSLSQRLKREESSRHEAHEQMGHSLKEFSQKVQRQFQQVEERTTSAEQALRQQLLERNKQLGDEMQRRYEHLNSKLLELINEQNFKQMDRSSLSTLLMDMAMRIAPQELASSQEHASGI
ncbi:MAG: hypothetical protein R2880_06595 [Deinococcales bacterium]